MFVVVCGLMFVVCGLMFVVVCGLMFVVCCVLVCLLVCYHRFACLLVCSSGCFSLQSFAASFREKNKSEAVFMRQRHPGGTRSLFCCFWLFRVLFVDCCSECRHGHRCCCLLLLFVVVVVSVVVVVVVWRLFGNV